MLDPRFILGGDVSAADRLATKVDHCGWSGRWLLMRRLPPTAQIDIVSDNPHFIVSAVVSSLLEVSLDNTMFR